MTIGRLYFETPGAWLLPLLLVVSVLATEEVLSLLRAKGHRPIGWIVYLGNVAIPLAAGLPIVLSLCGSKPAERYRSDSAMLAAGGAGGVRWCWCSSAKWPIQAAGNGDRECGAFGVHAGLCRAADQLLGAVAIARQGNDWGMAALFSTLLIVKMADTGAFAFGKTFGRHKMTPILSPGKTWEGIAWRDCDSLRHFVGVFSVCRAANCRHRATWSRRWRQSWRMECSLALAGMIGDLAESLLKRDMQRKDSSTWLPGLGGVLDIIDAPLVAGPVAWLCWSRAVGPVRSNSGRND